MNTAVIDPIDGKVKATLSGPSEYHLQNIGNMIAIETQAEDLSAKKGEMIDGVWQLVDDIEKLTKNAKKAKDKEISSSAAIITEYGIQVDGEEFSLGAWIPCSVTIGYSQDGIRFIEKITNIYNSYPELVSWVLFGGKRISTENCSVIIFSWKKHLADVAISEDAKKMMVIEAQTIEAVEAINSEVTI